MSSITDDHVRHVITAIAEIGDVDYKQSHLSAEHVQEFVWELHERTSPFTSTLNAPVVLKNLYIQDIEKDLSGVVVHYPDTYKIQLYDFLHTHCAADKIWNILRQPVINFQQIDDDKFEMRMAFECEAITITNKMSERRVLYDKFVFNKEGFKDKVNEGAKND
jgi:hypothetical protein